MMVELKEIPIEAVQPSPDQPRKEFETESLEELAVSIRDHGLIQPVVVEVSGNSGYLIVDGERRWRACRMAGLKTIQAVIRPAMNHGGEDRFILALTANLQRKDLGPVEEGRAYKRFIDQGWSIIKVANTFSISQQRVNARLKLLQLDDEIQQLMNQGRLLIDIRLAEGFLGIQDRKARVALAQKLAEQRAGLKASIEACQRVADRLRAEKIGDDEVPSLRLGLRKVDLERPKWDALAQVGKLPPWPLAEKTARRTCDSCPLREHASAVTCGECPLVDMIRMMVEESHGR